MWSQNHIHHKIIQLDIHLMSIYYALNTKDLGINTNFRTQYGTSHNFGTTQSFLSIFTPLGVKMKGTMRVIILGAEVHIQNFSKRQICSIIP